MCSQGGGEATAGGTEHTSSTRPGADGGAAATAHHDCVCAGNSTTVNLRKVSPQVACGQRRLEEDHCCTRGQEAAGEPGRGRKATRPALCLM